MLFRALILAAFATPALAAPAPILVPVPRAHIESLSATADGTIYASSTAGIVFRAAPGAEKAVAFVPADATGRVVLGVFPDEKAGLLWVCRAPNIFRKQQGVSTVMAHDLKTGAPRAEFAFPAGGKAMCNDFAVDRDGSLFVTDTPGARIFRIAPGGKTMQLFAEDPALLGGVDGIAFTSDGAMIVNNVRSGAMLRIDRKPDGSFANITQLATSMPLMGPDGLRLIAGNRLLQGEGPGKRVAEITINGDKAEVRVLATGLDWPVGVTPARATAWAGEGKLGYLVDPALADSDPGDFHILPIATLR